MESKRNVREINKDCFKACITPLQFGRVNNDQQMTFLSTFTYRLNALRPET